MSITQKARDAATASLISGGISLQGDTAISRAGKWVRDKQFILAGCNLYTALPQMLRDIASDYHPEIYVFCDICYDQYQRKLDVYLELGTGPLNNPHGRVLHAPLWAGDFFVPESLIHMDPQAAVEQLKFQVLQAFNTDALEILGSLAALDPT